MNLSRQPFLLALLTLLALVTAALLRRQGLAFPIETVGAPLTFAGRWLVGLQNDWPRVSGVLCGVLAVISALVIGRIGVRYKLYGGGTLLSIPFYGVIACCIYLSPEPLLGFSLSFLLALALRYYCASYRNGYTFDALFRGSVCLGLIPLLWAPALPVAVLLPVGALLFKRTLRELIVALCGFLLPVAAFSYLHWAFGAPFEEVVMQLADQCRFAAAPWEFDSRSFVGLALSAVVALLVLGGTAAHVANRYASSTKARAILTADLWLLAACLFVPFLTAPTVLFLPLLAVPASVLIPFLFVRLRAAFANLLYLSVLALVVLHLFL